MAKLTIGQKAERTLRLLIGLRNPRIAAALAAHGFTEADLREGWQRLAALTRKRLSVRAPVKDPGMLEALDLFENTWFPITRAALDHHYPELSELFFLNLSQTTGPGVAVTVATFLERLADLEKDNGSFGESGPLARELLAQRGLTADKVKDAQVLVEQLGSFVGDAPEDTSVDDQRAAEEKLWAWYREWSGIARVAIRDGRLLRTLGFLGKRSSGDPTPTAAVTTPTLAGALPVRALSAAAVQTEEMSEQSAA